MNNTILGSSGFIGTHLTKYLKEKGEQVFTPERDYQFNKEQNLGNIFYCIGLTSDFRSRPMDTVKAHVCKLIEVLENSTFDSFTYLSSARLYYGLEKTTEDQAIKVNPTDFNDLYNISKLMGESVCLSIKNEKVRVARLSNVIGNDFKSDNFLFSLIKDAVNLKKITLNTSLNSEKDYISIDDTVNMLFHITNFGKHRIYNVASGHNITNSDILNEIKKHTKCDTEISKSSSNIAFPVISIELLKQEFRFSPKNILDDINLLIDKYQSII